MSPYKVTLIKLKLFNYIMQNHVLRVEIDIELLGASRQQVGSHDRRMHGAKG